MIGAHRVLVLACLSLVLAYPLLAGTSITPAEARSHTGETATVCGVVASTKYAEDVRGRPTFLNLEKPYPNQVFTVVIWGSDRARFGQPERDFAGANICVTGLIESYKGRPEIIARQPSQIRRADP